MRQFLHNQYDLGANGTSLMSCFSTFCAELLRDERFENLVSSALQFSAMKPSEI
jgi:hypothetical protein